MGDPTLAGDPGARPGARLAGRVAIVTGASRGIGRSVAELFAAEGAAVAVAARTGGRDEDDLPGSLEETVAAITARGGRAVAVRCDVTVEDDLVRLVDVATRQLGPIDTLVNNAAATVPGRVGRRPRRSGDDTRPARVPTAIDMPLKAVRTQFEVNLFAPWRLIQIVAPGMAERGRGWIINIGSNAAHRPGPMPAYGASKIALEHMTASAALALRANGVSVVALVPSGPVRTPGLDWVSGPDRAGQSAEEFAEAVIRMAVISPGELDGAVCFSDDVLRRSPTY